MTEMTEIDQWEPSDEHLSADALDQIASEDDEIAGREELEAKRVAAQPTSDEED